MLPHVTLCLATSLDGKIAAAPGSAPDFTSRFDRQKLFRLRAESDALLIGAATVRQEELPPLVRDPGLVAERVRAGKPPHPAAVLVSASLDLPWQSRYFSERQQRILVLTAMPDAATCAALAANDLTLLKTGDPLSLRSGLEQLANLGYRKILGEGGGRLTHSLLSAGLVDRLCLTLAPTFIGGERTPSLCHGPLLQPRPELTLVEVTRVGDELHLDYRRR